MSGTTKTKPNSPSLILSPNSSERRNFLRLGAASVAGTALSPFLQACAQLDRIMVGDGSDETQSVMILGGGLSGLTAARELKKMGVPFRVFEGSQRIGGRALTLDEFNVASQSVDLGAEWISVRDELVLNLCHELRVGTTMLSSQSRTPQIFSSRGGPAQEFEKLLPNLKLADRKILEAKDRLTDEQLDGFSVEDLISYLRTSIDETSGLWMKRMTELEWGEDPRQVSALNYLDRFGKEPTGWKRALEKRIRVRGGVQNITQALYDKVAGVVPGRFVLFDHKLRTIRDHGDRLKMGFETKDGSFNIEARVVICTLPFSALRQVKGIDELDLSPMKLKAIQELGYGSHGKIAMSFKEKFWSSKSPVWTGDLQSQWIWESGVDSSAMSFGSRGILAGQMAGEAGRHLGAQSLNDFREDCKRINSGMGIEENSQMMNWALNPMSLGSVSYFKKGQMHQFSSSLSAPERKGSFIFAGEHTSMTSMGTLNGAVESGIRAAIEASRFKNEFGKKLID